MNVPERERQRWQQRVNRRRHEAQKRYGRSWRSPNDFKHIARRLGLRFEERADTAVMYGRARGCVVEVERRRSSRGQFVWQVRISNELLPPRLEVSSETGLKRIAKAFGGEDILTGDPAFDERVHLRGPEVEVLALLDTESRRWVSDCIEVGGVIKDRQLTLTAERNSSVRGWFRRVRRWIDGVNSLVPRAGPVELRLLRNAVAGNHSGVRLRNLVAAWQVNSEAVIKRQRAVSKCALCFCWMLREGGDREPQVRKLDECAATSHTPRDLRDWVCHRLAEFPLAERSPDALLAMLHAADDSHLRLELVEHLGARGTRAAVPTLVELSSGLFRRPSMKDAARRAAAAIMRRSGSKREGGLALSAAGASGGALSDSSGAGSGGVSMTD